MIGTIRKTKYMQKKRKLNVCVVERERENRKQITRER